MSDPDEKRRSPRCPIDLFVEENLDGETYLHPAVDLSVHGIYILSQDDRRAVDFTRSINIAFTLPTGTTIEASGRIVEVHDHRGQRGIRVAFNSLDDTDASAIRTFIDDTLGAEAA
jgi:hypothetical protein